MSTVNSGEIFRSLMESPTAQPEQQLKVLTGNAEAKSEGSWVFTSQGVAAEQGFRNVSKHWYKQTISYEDGLNLLEQGKAQTEDILATVREMVPGVSDSGRFVFRYRDGREFTPTEHAVVQVSNWADCGTWFASNMLKAATDNKGRLLYDRDARDAETLAAVFANGMRDGRVDPEKKFLWRTRKDGSLRAMLTERYAIIDNRWFVERLKQFISAGRLSHWRGDSDTVFGNVLISDTIREEKDSDYGGMLSVGNSEIGERRVSSVPSIFRAICMNGCIWGQIKGEGIRQVHRGKVDLDKLALEIKENLNKQIPLLPQGIDALLGIRTYAWDGCSAKPVFAQVSKDFKLSKGQAASLLTAYQDERAITPEFAATLFGVVNSVTRAGQKRSNTEWVRFDEIGGELSRYKRDDFDRLVSKAKHLKEKEVDEVFASV
jgi:hypothetical protein